MRTIRGLYINSEGRHLGLTGHGRAENQKKWFISHCTVWDVCVWYKYKPSSTAAADSGDKAMLLSLGSHMTPEQRRWLLIEPFHFFTHLQLCFKNDTQWDYNLSPWRGEKMKKKKQQQKTTKYCYSLTPWAGCTMTHFSQQPHKTKGKWDFDLKLHNKCIKVQ